jgi:hypothetical protein
MSKFFIENFSFFFFQEEIFIKNTIISDALAH